MLRKIFFSSFFFMISKSLMMEKRRFHVPNRLGNMVFENTSPSAVAMINKP